MWLWFAAHVHGLKNLYYSTKQLRFQASEEMPCRVAVQQLGKQMINNNNNNNNSSKPFPGHSPISINLFHSKEYLDFLIHKKMQGVNVGTGIPWVSNTSITLGPWNVVRMVETKSREKNVRNPNLRFLPSFPTHVASKMVKTSIFFVISWSNIDPHSPYC